MRCVSTSLALLLLTTQVLAAPRPEPKIAKKVSLIIINPPQEPFTQDFERASASTLSEIGLQVVPKPVAKLDEVVLTLGCADLDLACLKSIGQNLNVDYLVVVNSVAQPSPNLNFQFFDVNRGQAWQVGAIAMRDWSSLSAKQAALDLAQQFHEAPSLEVHTQPPGAQIFLDDTAIGTSPLHSRQALTVGRHKLKVVFAEGLQIRQDLFIQAGENRVLSFQAPLGAAAQTDGSRQSGSQGSKNPGSLGSTIGWSFLGLSVLSGLSAGAMSLWLQVDNARYAAQTTVGTTSVKTISRTEAKALVNEMQYVSIAAMAGYAISLGLAIASATIMGVEDAG